MKVFRTVAALAAAKLFKVLLVLKKVE